MKKLSQAEERRRNAALTIVKTLSEEFSVIAKPLSSIDIINIPNSVEPAVKNWIRRYKGKSEVYGSSAMATHSIHARRPQDLDLVIDNPSHAAHSLSQLMNQRNVKTRIVANPEWGSYVVQINIKGEWKDALDIHPTERHYGKYDFYGSSQKPLNKNGINIQRSSDQLLRKFNAVTQIDKKTGKMGAATHREVKDTQDAIQIAELLLASMELKSKAQLAKAQKVKAELKVWKAHLAKLKGSKKTATKRKPLSTTRQKKFVGVAVNKPSKDIDDLIFENGKVVERKIPLAKVSEALRMVAVNPYYGITESPYSHKYTKKQGVQMKKKKASVPYNKALKHSYSFYKNIKRIGRKKCQEN